MITIPIWLLILLIGLAALGLLGGLSIRVRWGEEEKKEDPHELDLKVTPDAQYQPYEVLGKSDVLIDHIAAFHRGYEAHEFYEAKNASREDYFRIICVDEERQLYLPVHQVQQMTYQYFLRQIPDTDASVRFIQQLRDNGMREHPKWSEKGEENAR